MGTIVPQQSGHAPGWKWRESHAASVERPWAWSEINGGEDLPPQTYGLCESGWHSDCPQAPLATEAGPGQCSCPCHLTCQWFALCANSATGHVAHPILPPVPTCDRCADALDLVFIPSTRKAS